MEKKIPKIGDLFTISSLLIRKNDCFLCISDVFHEGIHDQEVEWFLAINIKTQQKHFCDPTYKHFKIIS